MPKPIGINITAALSFVDGAHMPLVRIKIDEHEIQLSPADARRLATNINNTASYAECDSALVAVLDTNGTSREFIQMILEQYQEHRGQLRKAPVFNNEAEDVLTRTRVSPDAPDVDLTQDSHKDI